MCIRDFISIKATDVLAMGTVNVFNDSTVGGTALGASVNKAQVMLSTFATGTTALKDTIYVDKSGWTKGASFTYSDGHVYSIYNHSTLAAQLIIDNNSILSQTL